MGLLVVLRAGDKENAPRAAVIRGEGGLAVICGVPLHWLDESSERKTSRDEATPPAPVLVLLALPPIVVGEKLRA